MARVETKLSFLNQLVGSLTFGIYTPMEIKVTCAAGGVEDTKTVDSARELESALEEGLPFLIRVR